MKRIDRRRFLEQSLLGATAAAFAVSGPSWAFPDEPKRGRKIGPNDKISLAVIGVNGQGGGHVSAYAGMDDVILAAICDIDPAPAAKAIKAVEEKGKRAPAYVQDLRRVMDDPNIDAVSIATPNHWHALAAIWAMQAGKDVYVEKPVSHNVLEGRRMVEAARKHGRICQTGTQCRTMQGTRDAIDYVHAGKIGQVMVARGLCYKRRDSIGKGVGEIPAGADYNLWIGPAPMKPLARKRFHYDWHWFWDYGNGDLGNQGIHQMDIARWGLGKEGLPKSALGIGGRFGYQDDGETPNTHLTFLDYGDGQLIFEVRGLPTEPLKGAKVGVIFHGTEGYVVLTSYTQGAAFDLDGKLVQKFEGGGSHFRNFLDAMRSRKHTELHADIEEGHVSSALCHLGNVSYVLGSQQPFSQKTQAFGDDKEAYETFARCEQHLAENGIKLQETSYRVGKKLNLDPAKEACSADPAANQLFTREYRAPFVVPEKV